MTIKMTNKEMFCKAIARLQNYISHCKTKCLLLEKAFGSDTVVMDFSGIEEILTTTVDMSSLMFSNLSYSCLKYNIEWYVYEAVNMENPMVGSNNKTWIINSSEDLYDMLENFNEQSNNI